MMAEQPLGAEIGEAEMADEQLYEELAPKGKFTARGLNALVKATNALLPAFDQSGDYPTFTEDLTVLPTDFTRILVMFTEATSEAVASDAIDAEMEVSLEGIMNDTGLMQLSGKLSKLAKDRAFKSFLQEEAPDEMPETEVVEDEAMSAEDEDALMMERL